MGEILLFRGRVERAWLIVNLDQGRCRGELMQRGTRGPIRYTEVGSLRLVEDAIKSLRDGLPVYRSPRPSDGGAAA